MMPLSLYVRIYVERGGLSDAASKRILVRRLKECRERGCTDEDISKGLADLLEFQSYPLALHWYVLRARADRREKEHEGTKAAIQREGRGALRRIGAILKEQGLSADLGGDAPSD